MSVTDAAQLKENLRQSFRKACLKRIEGQEAEAVKILQEELPTRVKAWQENESCQPGDIENLLSEEMARTENAAWLLAQLEKRVMTQSQAEAMQAVLAAKLQMEIAAIRQRLEAALGEMVTYQGAEALGGRISQELSERVRVAVGEAFGGRTSPEVLLNEISEKVATADGVAAELAGFEKREAHRWADRQGAWTKALEGVLKRDELESALWQAQNAIGERLDSKTRGIEGLSAELKAMIASRLERVVTAEAFESRLMASVTMLHDAFVKALQEAQTSLNATLEKRLAETTAPIYQKVSSLITFNDWERVQREANEKFAAQLSSQVEENLTQIAETLGARQGEMEAGLNDRMEALIMRVQDVRTMMEPVTALSGGVLQSMQKELSQAQTQALGMLSVQQQNFMGGLQRDWALINKHFEELKGRQSTLEQDFHAVAAVVDAFRQEQVKSREAIANAMHLLGEQLKAMEEMQRQLKQTLPTLLSDAVGKKMKTLKVIAE